MKVTCISYSLPKDEFIFSASFETVGGQEKSEIHAFSGQEVSALENKKIIHCTDIEIAVHQIHRIHFVEEPVDMLNQSVSY